MADVNISSPQSNNADAARAARPVERGRGGWRRLFGGGLALLLLVAIGLGLAVYEFVEESRCLTCSNNLFEIGLMLRSYHQRTGRFPPAQLCGKTGKPVNSWRTVIVPGQLWYTFPSTYDFSQPWDSPRNAGLLSSENLKAQRHFQCPSDRNDNPAITNYVAVVGPNTVWSESGTGATATNNSDSEKILVIEVVNSDISWAEPRDLTVEQALEAIQPKKGIGVGSRHRAGIHYVTVSGQVRVLDRNIDRESLRRLLVRP